MQPLGSLEASIMHVLWSSPSARSVADVVESLEPTHPVAYTTVMTVLERLREKQLVERTKSGRAFLYLASMTGEEYISGRLDDALNEASDRTAALARFAGTLSESEAIALRRALDEST
ncbi:MAG: BlaI/MecI/CopY family transcriptional regulator [Actinomycetota bacterium]|nr:BlaI/MecI/CopY family transcriptional regulator [Actinomycetota bacterium]